MKQTVGRTVRASLVLGGLGLAVVCCEQILSIDGNISIQPTTNACNITLPTGSCASCVMSQCCDQASACAGVPACVGLESCLLACGADYACRAQCGNDHPIGDQVEIPTLETCVAGACNDACGMLCGTAGSYTTPDAAQACQDCINLRACPSTLACASSLPCEMAGHCAYACPTPDCRAACADAGGAGALVSSAINVGECLGVCQFGHDWACVGTVSFPIAKSASQQATLAIYDVDDSNKPLPGITTLACKPDDTVCTPPFSTGVTDASGVVALPLPVNALPAYGFEGHFEMTSPGGTIQPLLYFLSYPLSEPDAHLSIPLLTSAYFTSLATTAGVHLDADRGHVWLVAFDCLQLPAAGVTVAVEGLDAGDTEVREVYFGNDVPMPGATETDPSGTMFLFNAPVGQLTLNVTPGDIGRVSSSVTVFVRAGAVSAVPALPTPPTQ